MNLERMKQAAIESSGGSDTWAVICTDGDIWYYETPTAALEKLREVVDRVEFLSGEAKHDYGLVRVDIE